MPPPAVACAPWPLLTATRESAEVLAFMDIIDRNSSRRRGMARGNPTYVDVAVECWQRFSGASAVLAETGETFADLKAKRLAA